MKRYLSLSGALLLGKVIASNSITEFNHKHNPIAEQKIRIPELKIQFEDSPNDNA